MLGEGFTPFEQAAPRECQSYIDEVGNGGGRGQPRSPHDIAYIKAPMPDFEKASLWTGLAVANPWMLYMMVSQPA